MKRMSIAGSLLAVAFFGSWVVACATEECRTVEVRNPRDVEVCRTRCNDNGCREHCAERERWSREHRCWVE
jgi:hypothetical protein